jgi:hypothetical protein
MRCRRPSDCRRKAAKRDAITASLPISNRQAARDLDALRIDPAIVLREHFYDPAI